MKTIYVISGYDGLECNRAFTTRDAAEAEKQRMIDREVTLEIEAIKNGEADEYMLNDPFMLAEHIRKHVYVGELELVDEDNS